jgi:hypothetical protein
MKVHITMIALVMGLPAASGCGSRAAQVTGQVTCQGKPVIGTILFSPKGETEARSGSAVNAPLDEEGNYDLQLNTIGTYTVVITPRNVRFPVPPGEVDYPCDRSPLEREVQAGHNDITIELTPRSR